MASARSDPEKGFDKGGCIDKGVNAVEAGV